MKKIISLLFCTLCLSSLGKAQIVEQQGTYSNFELVKDSLSAELDEIFARGRSHGFAVAIVDEHGSLYERGMGFGDKEKQTKYTKNTIQHIASISKTLIGLALMRAQELDLLKLDDPVNKYLPFKVINPHFPNEVITIRHLATHTSTIYDTRHYMENAWIITPDQDLTNVSTYFPYQRLNPSEKDVPMDEFLEMILAESGKFYEKDGGYLKNKPGERFNYSNIGATLAALIIERAAKTPFNEFTKAHILDPLEMNSSGWSLSEIELENHARLYSHRDTMLPFYTAITYPDGMLITSASDMAKYLTELIKGYAGTGTLLEAESYKELFTEYLTEVNFVEERDAGHPYNDEYNSGIFMGFSALGNVGHAGGDAGVATWMFFNKETKIGRFIMRNTQALDREDQQQYYDIWDKLGEYSSRLLRDD